MKCDKEYFRKNFFSLDRYRVSADMHSDSNGEENEATVKIIVPAANAKGKIEERFIAENQPKGDKFIALSASANGDGTVDALDRALRKLLEPIYPFLKSVRLIRYAVSNTSNSGTGAQVEVFILASNGDGKLYYSAVSSASVIEASFFALANIYNRYFSDERENASKKSTGKK
ncbi:MAG TPA: alpha-isopropylmalate synthase regulatory domain-containing protein [bacterium]|nr:alpha-isopropylmalate synthase regulatory domain-containing protein [bacterium]HPN93125.1 alpha-isopropylmalate synthase regulatory domain-containing protein [bacterium]